MELKKAIFLFIVVISSLTSFSCKKEKTQLGLIEVKTSTIQKSTSYNFIKNVTNIAELELDEEQEKHSKDSIVHPSNFISCNTLAKVSVKFNFPLPSPFFPHRDLLYIIFLKILI